MITAGKTPHNTVSTYSVHVRLAAVHETAVSHICCRQMPTKHKIVAVNSVCGTCDPPCKVCDLCLLHTASRQTHIHNASQAAMTLSSLLVQSEMLSKMSETGQLLVDLLD